MSTSTSCLKVWTLNLYQSYFRHTVFTCAFHWGFCKHMPCTLRRIVTHILKSFLLFFLPVKFLNRFCFPLGMEGLSEGRHCRAAQSSPRSDWAWLDQMEPAPWNWTAWGSVLECKSQFMARQSHTKIRIWVYFEMKTYSKFLHEWDFFLRKIGHADSKWFSGTACLQHEIVCSWLLTTA